MSNKMNISIAGKEYYILAETDDAEIILLAQTKVQDTLDNLAKEYKPSEKNDLLAMALWLVTFDSCKNSKIEVEGSINSKSLPRIGKELDAILAL